MRIVYGLILIAAYAVFVVLFAKLIGKYSND